MWEMGSEAPWLSTPTCAEHRDTENLLAVLLTREDGVCVVEGELDLDLGPEFELVFGQSWLDMEPTMEPTTIVRWMS